MKLPIVFSSILFLFLLSSCSDEPVVSVIEDPLSNEELIQKYLHINLNDLDNYSNTEYPVHYDGNILNADNSPANNSVTDAGATLGRVLFYDQNLSFNGTISCASCHKQNLGFTDDDTFSSGFEEGLTGAHSMRLGNANFYEGRVMFWDKRATSLEDQSTKPIQDGVEMGFDEAHGGFTALIEKLQNIEYYPVLFEEVFGDPDITEERIQNTLAQFMRSMVSVNSKFDDGFSQVFGQGPNQGPPGGNNIIMDFPNFTELENLGKRLFILPPQNGGAGCQGCHSAPAFALNENSLSNGLDQGETTIFKSPSLKNIGLTGPYMHDGRFETLEEVVEHYNSEVKIGPALDNRLRMGPNPLRLNLNIEEKQALVAFLKTLSDGVLISDMKFSSPFK